LKTQGSVQLPPPTGRDPLDDELTLRDYLQIFSRRRNLIVLCTVLGVFLALGANYFMRPLYKTTATVRIDTMSMGQSLLTETLLPASHNVIGTEAEVIQSRTIVERAIQNLDLEKSLSKPLENGFEELVTLIREDHLQAKAPRNTDIVDITASWYVPGKAALIANRVMQEYIAANIQRKQTEAKKARVFLDGQIEKMKRQLERGEQAFSLRETKVNEILYKSLLEKRETAQIQENTTIGDAWIMDPAKVPIKPSRPRKWVNLALGLIGGLIVGLFLASLREHFDDRIHNPSDAEQVTGKPVLGVIPWIPYAMGGRLILSLNAKARDDAESLPKRLITSIGMNSPIVEAYRGLRTNLLYTSPDQPQKVLLITSCGPAEGKTLTTTNLALAISQTGQKVVVVDADLRKPMQHKLAGVPQKPGLSDYLSGQVQAHKILRRSKDKEIHVISAGKTPPNPPELLGSRRMTQLLKTLRKDFDYVLLDSPPVLVVTDPAVLLPSADGVILICRPETSHRDALAEAVRILSQTKTPILGVALNALSAHSQGYSYGFYYGYGESGPGFAGRMAVSPHEKKARRIRRDR